MITLFRSTKLIHIMLVALMLNGNLALNTYAQTQSLIASPSPAYLGTIPVSSSETTTFSLLNVKSTSVTITGISITGSNASDYSILNNPFPATVGAYNEFSFNLVYTPSAPGKSTAIMEIQTSAGSFTDTLNAYATTIHNNLATFERILGIESNIDKSKSLQLTQTANGDFVLTGTTILRSTEYSYITFDVYLLKTDRLGKLLWYRVFEFGTNGGQEIVDGGADRGIDVLTLADESIMVLGTTNAGGPGSISVYLSKWTGDGTFLWEKTYGGKYDDLPYYIKQDSDGNFMIVGSTNNTADNSRNTMIMKIAPEGTLIWNKNYGTAGIESGFDIVEAHDGGYIVVGNSQNPVANLYFLKIDKDGNEQWNKVLANAKACEASTISKTSDGGYVVSGYTLTDDLAMQGYLVKVNATAELQWSKTFGEGNIDLLRSHVETPDGGFLCVGSNNRFWSIEYNYDDIWVIKTDNSGNLLWERKYGGNKTQYASDVLITKDGGFALVGETESYREKPRIYLMGVNKDGMTVGIKHINESVSSDFSLSQNFPNPFNLNTIIEFNIPQVSSVKVMLKVYDMLGKEISTLVENDLSGGTYQVNYNAGDSKGGIYFFRLCYGTNTITKKMVLIK